MSDMMLVLHERIKAVRRGVHIGSARLREAQDNIGLSNEKLARRLYVSEKTWRRWRDIGEIPREHLPAVARELGLRLEPVDFAAAQESDRVAGLERRQAQLVEMVDSLRESQSALVRVLEQLVDELRSERRRTGSPS